MEPRNILWKNFTNIDDIMLMIVSPSLLLISNIRMALQYAYSSKMTRRDLQNGLLTIGSHPHSNTLLSLPPSEQSTTNPKPILDMWREETGMDITLWNDPDYRHVANPKLNPKQKHRRRQRQFYGYAECMQHHKAKNYSWGVALIIQTNSSPVMMDTARIAMAPKFFPFFERSNIEHCLIASVQTKTKTICNTTNCTR